MNQDSFAQDLCDGVKARLAECGRDVIIYPLAKIVKPEVVKIGDGTRIDDFTFIFGGQGIELGRHNHIGAFVSIVGGGKLITGDYVGIATGARIITGTDHYGDGKRMSPLVPLEHRNLILGTIRLENDVFIGTNVIVHPNVTVGEGAIIGSGSLVLKDVEPWTINVGIPCRCIGKRPKIVLPDT